MAYKQTSNPFSSPFKARKLKQGYSSVAGKNYDDMNWRERTAKRKWAKQGENVGYDHKKVAPRPGLWKRIKNIFR